MWRWAGHARRNRFSAKFGTDIEYRVDLSARAERDVVDIYLRINAAESLAAAKWFNRLEVAIVSLTQMPGRCPRAPESKRAKVPLYHRLYRNKPDVYRAIYAINETACLVNVLTIRHGAMDMATPAEIESWYSGKP